MTSSRQNIGPKPDPVIYDDMLKKSGLNANTSVMIEDMAVNLEPASHRGITTVWLDHESALEQTRNDCPLY